MTMHNMPFTNTGHGQVWPRPDRLFMRCNTGPGVCLTCGEDAQSFYDWTEQLAVGQWQLTFAMHCVCGRTSEQTLRQEIVPGRCAQTGMVVCPTCLREYVLMGCSWPQGPVLVTRDHLPSPAPPAGATP